MKRRHTCQESEEKWKKLLTLSQFGTKHPPSMSTGSNKDNDDHHRADNSSKTNELFDSQGMEAPTTKALVDGVLEEFTAKWRALDDRRIVIHNHNQNSNDHDDSKKMPPPPPKRARHQVPGESESAAELEVAKGEVRAGGPKGASEDSFSLLAGYGSDDESE
jgi:tRNA U34 5-methylaminomethyl-2-thiouridine-forming methyltransferase MnmC